MFLAQLLRRFAEEGVSYCIVGGVAVNLHGVPRMTYDIDLVLDMTAGNLETAERLLTELGLSCRLPLKLPQFADAAFREQMRDEKRLVALTFTDPGDPLQEVDILVSPGVPPVELIERAVDLNLEGTPIRVISLPDLIALKRASGRSQDGDDVELLERIREEDEPGDGANDDA